MKPGTILAMSSLLWGAGCAHPTQPAMAPTEPACAVWEDGRCIDAEVGQPEGDYRVVVYRGDDVSEETDALMVGDYAACRTLADSLNRREGIEAYYVEVTP